MKINILLPYKEQFNKNKASSVSITVKNNLTYSKFLKNIKIYGQHVEKPLFKNNFSGINYSYLSFKSKNQFLAKKMINIIKNEKDQDQLIEVHNRPYLINEIVKNNTFPVSLFIHNDPQKMKGSKSVKERHNILNKCAAVFCVSEFIKNKFIEGIQYNLEKIVVLHNGVERKLKKFPLKQREVLYVGRLVPEKGVDLYVDAVQNIAWKFPNWKFSLIGSYRLGENINTGSFSNNIITKFKKNVKQNKFYGFKSQNFVQKKMKGASVIVIPSIWEEPFGLVAAEAMSNGIAIIASDIGGIPEIIKKNGILIRDINLSKIEDELSGLLGNPDKLKKLQKLSWNNFKFFAEKSSKKLDKHRELILSNYLKKNHFNNI